ncbi:MAG: RNA polymerase sigma factor [Candidatus Eremiobacteraeota bacterium]|nr:RNA polymerase sigma factor [Candidatus Eremiobacteraeota bacterium]
MSVKNLRVIFTKVGQGLVQHFFGQHMLMEQSIGSDAASFEACYCAHQKTVHSVALRMVGNRFEADDVTQQVFLRVWSNPGAFRGGNVAAWLTRIAHNLSVDVLRRRRETPLGDASPDAYSRTIGRTEGFEDKVARDAADNCVRNALQMLKPSERHLIIAAFIDEQTHAQIAQAATLPLGTVKTRIRTGLQRLRPLVAGLR